MKYNKLWLSVILLGSLGASSKAQTTGSFKIDIVFNEVDYKFTRAVYFYVPTNYDQSNDYALVVGFRGGPHTNAGQFRDQLSFLADSLEAIVVCPENEGHFNNQEGLVKQLFKYTVDTVKSMYSIDDDNVFLTGLSYGGRHAVIVAMDTDNGPIPKLKGVIPFATGSNGHLEPNYSAVDQFAPACICIGLNDNTTFKNVATTLYNDIKSNGGEAMLNEIPNVGHTVDFPSYPSEMMKCFAFIEGQGSSGVQDVDQERIKVVPNPASGRIEIRYPNKIVPERAIIMDAQGRLVMELNVLQQAVDLSLLSTGVFVLQILLEGESHFIKISVIH